MLEESILVSIKKLLGIHEDDNSFDTDVIIHINSAFMVLYQLGVGDAPFFIEDDAAMWSDYFGERTDLNGVLSYVYMKVKLIFDPPASSVVTEAMKESIREFEWRINAAVDRTSNSASQGGIA